MRDIESPCYCLSRPSGRLSVLLSAISPRQPNESLSILGDCWKTTLTPGFCRVLEARLAVVIFADQALPMNISPTQVKVARALLGWSQSGLALKAGVDRPTLHQFEEQNVERWLGREDVTAIRQALEAAGIVFTEVSVTLSNEKARL